MNNMFNRFFVILERAYTPAFNLCITIATARLIGIDAVGDLAIVFISAILGQFLISRGTDQNMQVVLASCERNKIDKLAVDETTRRFKRLVFSLVLLTFSLFLVIFFDTAEILAVVTGVFSGSLSGVATPNETRLVVTQRYRNIVIPKYISGFLSFLLSFLLLFMLEDYFRYIPFVTVICERMLYLFKILRNLKVENERLANANFEKEKKIPAINIPVLINTAAVFTYNRLDQIYIYAVLSREDLGVFFSTLKLFEVVNLFVITAITSNLHIMANDKADLKSVKSIERKILFAGLFLIALIAFLSPVVLKMLFKITVADPIYIYIISIGTVGAVVGTIKGPWVATNSRYRINALFAIGGGVVALIYLTVGQPQKLEAIALTMAISQLTVNVLLPILNREERSYLVSLVGFNK